ncbi:hypothetical protein V7087_00060 [Neobacillus niacini]|uniref:tetratricopeptide repeat protein n=1 Tax=Neobacillus niacini TaxID=86668 RepID=UPI002FFF05A1
MLNKLIHTYQNTKLAAVKRFSDQEYDILEEPGFLDDGFIRMKIEGLKKELKKIDQQLEQLLHYDKQDDYHKQKVAYFMEQKDYIHFHMAFLASNGINSLEFAKQLIQEMNIDFSMCIEALLHHKKGNDPVAFELFQRYFSTHPEPLDHFLINKIYGLLLMNRNELENSARYLRKAAEKRPEDQEVHVYIVQVYESLGWMEQAQVHKVIVQMLGGDEDGDY